MGQSGDPIEIVRRRLQRSLRHLVSGSPEPPLRLAAGRTDEGLFGPESMTWRIHADAIEGILTRFDRESAPPDRTRGRPDGSEGDGP